MLLVCFRILEPLRSRTAVEGTADELRLVGALRQDDLDRHLPVEPPWYEPPFTLPVEPDPKYRVEYIPSRDTGIDPLCGEKDEDGNETLRDTRDYISIATTRPETMLGDTAVAVHPDDERYAGLDKINPGSLILSGAMMLDHLGWPEAADAVRQGVIGAINAKQVTYDLARQMEGSTEVACSRFAEIAVEHMPG